MNRNRQTQKAAHWAIWGIAALLCAGLYFQADRASSSRVSATNVSAQTVQHDTRAGAGTSAVDTLLW